MSYDGYAKDSKYGNVYHAFIRGNDADQLSKWWNIGEFECDNNEFVLGPMAIEIHHYPLGDQDTLHKVVNSLWVKGNVVLRKAARKPDFTHPSTWYEREMTMIIEMEPTYRFERWLDGGVPSLALRQGISAGINEVLEEEMTVIQLDSEREYRPNLPFIKSSVDRRQGVRAVSPKAQKKSKGKTSATAKPITPTKTPVKKRKTPGPSPTSVSKALKMWTTAEERNLTEFRRSPTGQLKMLPPGTSAAVVPVKDSSSKAMIDLTAASSGSSTPASVTPISTSEGSSSTGIEKLTTPDPLASGASSWADEVEAASPPKKKKTKTGAPDTPRPGHQSDPDHCSRQGQSARRSSGRSSGRGSGQTLNRAQAKPALPAPTPVILDPTGKVIAVVKMPTVTIEKIKPTSFRPIAAGPPPKAPSAASSTTTPSEDEDQGAKNDDDYVPVGLPKRRSSGAKTVQQAPRSPVVTRKMGASQQPPRSPIVTRTNLRSARKFKGDQTLAAEDAAKLSEEMELTPVEELLTNISEEEEEPAKITRASSTLPLGLPLHQEGAFDYAFSYRSPISEDPEVSANYNYRSQGEPEKPPGSVKEEITNIGLKIARIETLQDTRPFGTTYLPTPHPDGVAEFYAEAGPSTARPSSATSAPIPIPTPRTAIKRERSTSTNAPTAPLLTEDQIKKENVSIIYLDDTQDDDLEFEETDSEDTEGTGGPKGGSGGAQL